MSNTNFNNTENNEFGREMPPAPPNKPSRTPLMIVVGLVALALLFAAVILVTNDAPNMGSDSADTSQGVNYGDSRGGSADVLGLTIDTYIGEFFTHPETGMTLYVKKDGSHCTDECLRDFEPYLAEEEWGSGRLGVISRSDSGELQYAWKGRPLYTFKKDMRRGDVLGDGFDLVWVIARP